MTAFLSPLSPCYLTMSLAFFIYCSVFHHSYICWGPCNITYSSTCPFNVKKHFHVSVPWNRRHSLRLKAALGSELSLVCWVVLSVLMMFNTVLKVLFWLYRVNWNPRVQKLQPLFHSFTNFEVFMCTCCVWDCVGSCGSGRGEYVIFVFREVIEIYN